MAKFTICSTASAAALEDGLDAAVEAVAHPAAQAQPAACSLTQAAEEDALHAAGDIDVCSLDRASTGMIPEFPSS